MLLKIILLDSYLNIDFNDIILLHTTCILLVKILVKIWFGIQWGLVNQDGGSKFQDGDVQLTLVSHIHRKISGALTGHT